MLMKRLQQGPTSWSLSKSHPDALWLMDTKLIQKELKMYADQDNMGVVQILTSSFFRRSKLINESNLRTTLSTAQHLTYAAQCHNTMKPIKTTFTHS